MFQLLLKHSWTTAALEGKQYSFQLQKWQAPWLFMLCSVCLVLFLFCYLRDSWKRPASEPAAVPRAGCGLSSSPQSSALWCTSTAVASSSAEPRDINRGEKLKAHIWHVPHSHKLFATLYSTDGSAAWAELKIQLSGSNPSDRFFCLFSLYVISRVELLVNDSWCRHSPPLLIRAKSTKD